jgi:enoyl-CoA hydratase
MNFEHLLVIVKDGVATLSVNRPEKLNALDDHVVSQLHQAAQFLAADELVRGIILTGAGAKAFIAGADIGELARQGVLEGRRRSLKGQAMLRAFETMGKPVIAAVNGYALGGGCELAMACHIRIASENARFGQPEVKLGITPGYGGTQRLPRIVGKGNALHLLLTGEQIDAAEALRIGLVSKVVPAEHLLAEADQMMRTILANGPIAVQLVMEAVDRGLEMTLEQGLALEADAFGIAAATEDMKEGLAAFLEKRRAKFQGK